VFSEIGISGITKVGGEKASLGEMYNHPNPLGIVAPNGFALLPILTELNNLEKPLDDLLLLLDTK
jgi:pyruvate,water dikinase